MHPQYAPGTSPDREGWCVITPTLEKSRGLILADLLQEAAASFPSPGPTKILVHSCVSWMVGAPALLGLEIETADTIPRTSIFLF